MTNILEIINLSKKYDQNKNLNVLKNLNFKFKKGKIYSLIGPSGSGKSTLLNLLSLIDEPSSGKIKINEKSIDFTDFLYNIHPTKPFYEIAAIKLIFNEKLFIEI